jgi:UDP-N-acetylmuramoylalanine-D-glutamate ligase
VQRAGSVAEAVAVAAADAREGDVVLLSPGCAPAPRQAAGDVGVEFAAEVHRLVGDAGEER